MKTAKEKMLGGEWYDAAGDSQLLEELAGNPARIIRRL